MAPEKILMGIIILILFFVLSPLLFGDAFLGNSEIIDGFPVWFIPLLLLGLILGVYHLVRK